LEPSQSIAFRQKTFTVTNHSAQTRHQKDMDPNSEMQA